MWKSSTRPYFSHTARVPNVFQAMQQPTICGLHHRLDSFGFRLHFGAQDTLTSEGGTDLFPDNSVMSFGAARRIGNTCRESQGIAAHFEASDLIRTRPGIVP